jgi:hypothetical protein
MMSESRNIFPRVKKILPSGVHGSGARSHLDMLYVIARKPIRHRAVSYGGDIKLWC